MDKFYDRATKKIRDGDFCDWIDLRIRQSQRMTGSRYENEQSYAQGRAEAYQHVLKYLYSE